MTHRADIIVLACTRVGEKSIVVHCLTRQWGRRGFITSAGKTSSALLMPLSIIEGEVTENPRSQLWRLKSVSQAAPLGGLRSSMAKNAMSLFMSEVLYRTVHEGAYEEGLYEWCERSILTLDALESDYSNYHLKFMLGFASALGFSPSMEDLMPFAGEYHEQMEELLLRDVAGSMMVPLTGAQRSEIADALLRYLSFHCESQINVRSLSVLHELFKAA